MVSPNKESATGGESGLEKGKRYRIFRRKQFFLDMIFTNDRRKIHAKIALIILEQNSDNDLL